MIKVLKKIKKLLVKYYYLKLSFLSNNIKRISFYKFMEDGGLSLFLKGTTLNKNSIIFDVGGFHGSFTEQVQKICQCNIYIFEPVKEYYGIIANKNANNNKVHTFNAGLSSEEVKLKINVSGSSSSVFNNNSKVLEEISLISANDFIKKNNISRIDLMKINIEGGEYELLNSMCNNKEIINKIEMLLIQFHDFVPDAKNRRISIHEKLSLTHIKEWDYPFIFERWIKK